MTKRILISIVTSLAASVSAMAQFNCTPSTNEKLVCLVPFSVDSSDPTVIPQIQSQLTPFNGAVGAQLSQLPLAASATGLIKIRDANDQTQIYDNLGPVLIDRPDSVGVGRLVLGASFQQFNFNSLDGIGLGSVPIVYSTVAPASPQSLIPNCQTGPCTTYIAQKTGIGLQFDQYVALVTYGFPQKFDFTLIVPVARVSAASGSLAGAQKFVVDSTNAVYTQPAPVTPPRVAGLASGIGDIAFNLKKVLWSGGASRKGSLAAGGIIRIPTGDAGNFLGSGAVGFNLYALAAYKAPISPHVKIAYQWNSETDLLYSPITHSNGKLPGGFQFAVGADASLRKLSPHLRQVTVSVDIIGNQYANAPTFAKNSITLPFGSGPITAPSSQQYTIPTVSLASTTFTEANLSTGLKWRPLPNKDLVIYGNLLTQLNNVGLRSDLVPSGGISYNFDLARKRK